MASLEQHAHHGLGEGISGRFSRMEPPNNGGGNHHWALVIPLTPLLSDEESDQR